MATSGPAKVSWVKVRLWRAVLLGAFLLLWEVATRRGWVDPFFVSQPTVLAAQIFDWIRSGFILRHLFVTMQETIIGFLLGTLLGVAVGFTFARWQTLAHIFDPLMVALNAMPRVVLAPLFILWFGLGLLSKVVMVISLVFFVVFFSTYTGIREVDRDLVNNARILGANPRHMIRHVLLPSALTWIFSSLRTSVGFALIGAVVGEYLGSHEGMGYVISYAESMFNATGVLAGLLVLMAAVIAIDLALKRLDARFSYWKPIPKMKRSKAQRPKAQEDVMPTLLRRIVAVLVLLAVVVPSAPSASWAAEKVTVGIGGVGLMVYLPTVLAKSKGYFAEEGLDVEILDIKGGGSQAASALIGGSVDFSANAIDHAIKAKVQKKDLVAVHSHVRLPVMGLVVANKYKGEIKSLADLKGRPVGVTSPGSQTHMVLGYLLAKSGVKPDEVKIIGAGGNTMPLAIEKDSVHAGMMVDPFFTVFLKQGKGYALVDMFTAKGTLDAMGGEVQGTTLLTRPDVIAKKPATVQKMVNALVKANKLITSSSGEEMAKSLPSELAGDPKLYAESFEHAREAFPPDSLVSRDGVARVIETMRTFEAVPAGMKIEPESVFDNRYVLKALGR